MMHTVFIGDVVKKGASVIIGEKGRIPVVPESVAVLEVEDSLKALQALAKYHRLNSAIKIAAVTGSNGKSTTKQMLKSICEQAGGNHRQYGQFQQSVRAFLFLFWKIQPKHELGVFELGASHPGDIAETACLAVPDVAVITNISAAHLEYFKDLETVLPHQNRNCALHSPRGDAGV